MNKLPLLAILALVPACAALSPETQSKGDHVVQVYADIKRDGVVTPAEQDEFAAAVDDWVESVKSDPKSGLNWNDILISIGGAVSTAFLGVNVFRNAREKTKWGTPEAPVPTPASTVIPDMLIGKPQ